jgi:RNA polymerase sigma factor (sigma-70 family)
MDTDQELIAQVVEGDRGAKDRFVERYAGTVWSVIQRSVGGGSGEDVAGEIFSDVFLKLFGDNCRRLRGWRGDGSFRAYLAAITRNCGRDHFRKPGSVPKGYTRVSVGIQDHPEAGDGDAPDVDPTSEDLGPLDWLLQSERQVQVGSAVLAALDQLSSRDRELVERKHLSEESYKEMAEATGLSVNQVGVYLHRAEKRLTKIMQRECAEVME